MEEIGHLRKKFSEGEYAVSDHAIIEARKDGIEPNTVKKLEWVAIEGCQIVNDFLYFYI